MKYEGSVYKAIILNEIFENYNPYSDEIDGYWFTRIPERTVHTGQVYINETSLREVPSINDIGENNWYAEVISGLTKKYPMRVLNG